VANLLAPVAKAKFFDNAGRPADGYKLFTYAAGTNTKLDSYQNAAGGANTNPIILDFRGEADIWLPPNVAYKLVFSPASDTDPPTAPIWTIDDIVNSELVTLWGGVDTGFANAYVLNFTANFTSYTDGIVIYWIPSNTNTGASTINVNGLGPVPITNQNGTPLYLGQLQANEVALIVYRSTGFTLVAVGVNPTINTQNGAYTFQLNDANNIVQANAAGVGDWTIPTNASVPFPLGTSIDLAVSGVAIKTLVPAPGVTFTAFTGIPTPLSWGNAATRIVKIGTDEWQQFTPTQIGWTDEAANPYNIGGLVAGPTSISILSRVLDGVVTLIATSSRINTSNSAALTLSTLPANLRPSADVFATCYGVQDNGVTLPAIATVTSAGTISFQIATVPPSNFTAAGNKGILAGWSLVYPLR